VAVFFRARYSAIAARNASIASDRLALRVASHVVWRL
jgi:hypothetical protein